MLKEAKMMFHHGYDNYMEHAFPLDELNPLHCCGRGPDYEEPDNININDVLGDFCLTLVDTLDMLAIMGNKTEFQKAAKLIVDTVNFDKSNVVQVFEATIRMLGGLLSGHLLMDDVNFPGLTPDWYMDDLLSLAHDLAERLLPAFDKTETGIPLPRVNLKTGVPDDGRTTTCTAGAGSLLLEFSLLSRIIGDPVYEIYARRASKNLFNRRNCNSGSGLHPLYVNVEMATGNTATNWIDSLQASFAGVQLLAGDVDEAICHHALYYSIWKKYGCLPERYNWKLDVPDARFYPLRPELAES